MEPKEREAKLNNFIRRVLYMFYDHQPVMVMEGILKLLKEQGKENVEKFLLSDLNNITNLRNKDLEEAIGVLRSGGFISCIEKIDRTGLDPNQKLGERQKKERLRTYYGIDYKVFVETFRLKAEKAKRELESSCGKADNIFYKCTNPLCGETFTLIDLIRENDLELVCPECNCEVEKVDLSAKVNENKKRYCEFKEKIDKCLSELDTIVNDRLLFENKFKYRIDAKRMMTEEEYNVKKMKVDQHNRYHADGGSGVNIIYDEKTAPIIEFDKQETTVLNEDLVERFKKLKVEKSDTEFTTSTGKTFHEDDDFESVWDTLTETEQKEIEDWQRSLE